MKVSDLSLLGKKAEGFNLYHHIKDVDFIPFDVDESLEPDKKSPDNVIFDEIFKVNPFTGLPDGDLACFMSENTSPSVKQFIELNLRGTNNLPSDSGSFGSELSDDLIAEFTRSSNETVESYRQRLVNVVRDSLKSEQTKNE